MHLDIVGRQSPQKKFFFVERPAAFVLVIVIAGILVYGYRLRTEGILACPADGYGTDRYLAYCNGVDFGDYEHGAFWFDLEPSVKKYAGSVDAMFLGDSHLQFAFSTDATSRWFASTSSRYYLLGFIYAEDVVFGQEILRKLAPRASVYVIALNFFERTETLPAKEVMHDAGSRHRYEIKRLWQMLHRRLCENASILCGRKYAIFRSRADGEYRKSGRIGGPLVGTPVRYEHELDQEKVNFYSESAGQFLRNLRIPRECIILTTIPTVRDYDFAYTPSVATTEAVAKELGISFAAATLDGLQTFDGSHLDQQSAERWSDKFFEIAGPQISKCIKEHSRTRG